MAKLVSPLTIISLIVGLLMTFSGGVAAHFQATTRISVLEDRVGDIRASINSIEAKIDSQGASSQALALQLARIEVSIRTLELELRRDRAIRGYSR